MTGLEIRRPVRIRKNKRFPREKGFKQFSTKKLFKGIPA